MSFQIVFLLMVFAAVVLLSQSLFVSVYSPQRANTKLLKKHLDTMAESEGGMGNNLLLNKRVHSLSRFRASIESLPWVTDLSYKLELAGSNMLGHEYLFLALLGSALFSVLVMLVSAGWVFPLLTAGIVLLGFAFKLNRDINMRLERIEEQFPEAMDVLKRGLQAGYAFNDAIKLVFEEMEGDLADEFKIVFNRINFGNDVRTALLNFIKRVPSTSAMAFVSAVIIQKETGGNLAENIDKLSTIIRKRFTFRRRVRTLSAEGRLSGWILVLTPFAMFAMLYLSAPDYVTPLVRTPEGLNLIKWGGVTMLAGILWINKLIQIEA